MTIHPPDNSREHHRNGLTMLEVVVVMGIIALLVSLLAPALLSARSAARRTSCASHLRQLALAMTAHSDVHRKLPAAGYFEMSGSRQYHSWVTAILGEIDEGKLIQQYNFDAAYDEPTNLALTRLSLELLVCPEDISVEPGQGNLSYVASGGLAWTVPVDCPASLHADGESPVISPLDLNGNGVVCPVDLSADGRLPDTEVLERTSLFFVENWPAGTGTTRHHRIDNITDGTTQTILLSENVRAGFDPQTGSTWGSPDPRYNSFFVSSRICPDGRCRPDQIDLSLANNSSDERSRTEAINAALHQAEGVAPWPSSLHPGIVQAAYADGHVAPLSEGIDGTVYFRLVTPQGSRLSGPLGE